MALFISATEAGLLSCATRSTTDTLGVGTRIAQTVQFPFKLGKHKRHGLRGARGCGDHGEGRGPGPSEILVRKIQQPLIARIRVYCCHQPFFYPEFIRRTLQIGARQFVVQDAFETILCFLGSYSRWFTPMTIVISGPFAGADIITFLAPASKWAAAFALSVKRPVLSITIFNACIGPGYL